MSRRNKLSTRDKDAAQFFLAYVGLYRSQEVRQIAATTTLKVLKDRLLKTEGVGEKATNSIIEWLSSTPNVCEIINLIHAGVKVE